ncbi:MFS transporter [Streptomyces acidiscabies]|uniref:MFS transporter n=1 Tax=Streptomyces acidiscabies TaxID=42234 RepID=A0AAP6BAM3_9ACTN|nr:MFS transporter [Streptomyces acidiscabies]MBZ3917007.1 MFS transporter [Streptomyces acidiscabies]MDX2961246.1 MFS transporter [Streptomyces acidiscabies]MDX3022604.1 MFS transporter [Streptomyces acidiscabies]MDX3791968.1 MFS transporter [Streptomyces acidiscabies]GAQ56413.1 multidrug resistance protein 3 [Streptomyces acidiscabies]
MSHAQPRSVEPGVASAPRVNLVVAVLAFGGIVVSLMQTLVIPIVPELPKLLDASASDATWAVTATLLAAAVATPVTGRLGDMYGKRRMLLVSLVTLVAGSVVAALSDALAPMIVGRALQGLASGVIPLGISIMRDELPAERLGSATALMSASLGIGGALGLPAAALIADHFDWHMLFWTSAALGAVALVLVPAFVPESRVRAGGRFDFPGAAGMAAGLICLLLGISKGADWGWTSGTTLGLFAAAVVVLVGWGFFELRVAAPLVDLRTTARRQVLVTNLASLAFGFSMFAMSLVLPQLLQLPEATGYGLGRSLLDAGLVMAPTGLVMMAVAPVSALISKKWGAKVTLMAGAVIVAVGYGLGVVLMSEVWQLVLVSCVVGAGIGFAYGAMPALIMGAVDPAETAAANSLNTLMRSIGTSTASAVAGVILAQLTTGFHGAALPSENGFKVVMAVGSGAAVLAFVVAAFIPRRRTAGTGIGAGTSTEAGTGTEPATSAPPADARAVAPQPYGANAPASASAGPQAGTPDACTIGAAVAIPLSRAVAELVAAVPNLGDGVPGGTGRPVRGQVRGAENVPVPGAAVTLISLDGRQLGRAVAEADGTYEVQAPGEGTYVLLAAADGLQPQATTVVVGATPVSYDVLLSGSSGLAGVVRGADGGAPVAGAVVIVTDVRGDVLATTRTDGLGEFALTELVPGAVTVAVSSPKHRPLALPVEIAGTGVTRIEAELQPGAHVRGTVRGAGFPLGDARVTLVDAAGNVVATTTTGADGAYAFSDLDSGQYTVIATGYPPRATGVSLAGDLDGHDIELAHAE